MLLNGQKKIACSHYIIIIIIISSMVINVISILL